MVRVGAWLGALGLWFCTAASGQNFAEATALLRPESDGCEMKRLRPQIAVRLARPVPSALLANGLATLPGCARERVIAWSLRPELDRLQHAFEREIHVRHARAAGPDLLRLVDRLAEAASDSRDLLLAGTRLHSLYAFALLDEEDPAEARREYAKARTYGHALLAQPGLLAGAAPRTAAEMRLRLRGTKRGDVPALTWAAAAWGLDADARRDDPGALADQPLVEAVLARAIELDERYYQALPHLLLGRGLGSRSARLGGDPARARVHFEAALRLSGRRYLLAHVVFAKTYAVQAQDRKLFVALLQEVLRAPRGLDPSQALANAVARERAARLLARVDELILPDTEGK